MVQDLWQNVKARDPDQPEFLQAVEEVLVTMKPVFERYPQYIAVMERIIEPERQIMFRVRVRCAWVCSQQFAVVYSGIHGETSALLWTRMG